MRRTFGLMNEVRVIAVGHKRAAGNGLVQDFLVGGTRLLHIPPARAGNLPIGEIGVHARFLFDFDGLRMQRRGVDTTQYRDRAQSAQDSRVSSFHVYFPIGEWVPRLASCEWRGE